VVRGGGRRVQRQGCGGQVSHKSCAVPRLGQRGLEISLCILCAEHRERNARERQREARSFVEAVSRQVIERSFHRFVIPSVLQCEQGDGGRRDVGEEFLAQHVRVAVIPTAGPAHTIEEQALALGHPARGCRVRVTTQPLLEGEHAPRGGLDPTECSRHPRPPLDSVIMTARVRCGRQRLSFDLRHRPRNFWSEIVRLGPVLGDQQGDAVVSSIHRPAIKVDQQSALTRPLRQD
jgi:hypothetical protein